MESLENEIGQLMIIGLQGPKLLPEEAEFIISNRIGGVILFDRNLESPEQIFKLCEDVQAAGKKQAEPCHMFVSIDMEGGRVHRLKEPFTQWPAVKTIGDSDSTTLAFDFSYAMGLELMAFGINMNFAPSLDILTNPKNTVIGDRAVSNDPEAVAKLGSALVRGYIKSGVIPCLKHFPGHGDTLIDSHDDLPIETTTLDQLNNRELIPFKKALRARAEMVMMAHILFKDVDSENPASLSSKFINDILREQLRFQKVVITDDLGMGALTKTKTTEEIALEALQAGNDILLYCNEFEAPGVAINALRNGLIDGTLDTEKIQESLQRVNELRSLVASNKIHLGLEEALAVISNDDHKKLAKS